MQKVSFIRFNSKSLFGIVHALAFCCMFLAGATQIYAQNCTLPAPSNFKIVNIGSSWVRFSWDTVPGADHYRLRTKNDNTGTVVSDMVVDGVQNMQMVNNLTQGRYTTHITAYCDEFNGGVSESLSYEIVIVTDIVISGYVGGGTVDCIVPSGYDPSNHCGEFVWNYNPTNFKIVWENPDGNYGQTVNFSLQKQFNNNNRAYLKVRGTSNESNFFEFYTETGLGAQPEPNIQSTYDIVIRADGYSQPVCTLKVVPITTQGISKLIFMNTSGQNIGLYKLTTNAFGKSEFENDIRKNEIIPSERYPLTHNLSEETLIAPNPFQQHINIQFGEFAALQSHDIRLFDAAGRLVAQQLSQAGNSSVLLDTESLSPGLYILRIDSGNGQMQTVKVVKTR